MKKTFLIAFSFFFGLFLSAQEIKKHKIVVLTPLYLDSVFDESGNFMHEKNAFPRFVIPGLEYYQGTMAAIDSLQKRNAPLEFFIYDSRGTLSIDSILNKKEIENAEMIIAQTNGPETRTIAEKALAMKIPFISTSYPNDAGVYSNPYFVILNSTLQTHVEQIYSFVQKHHEMDNIVVFRKPGAQEDQLKNQLNEYATSNTGKKINLKYVNIARNFKTADLTNHLDSNKRNVIIAGSLDENFAMSLLTRLATINKTYPIRVIGMPNWERLNYSKFPNLEIIYSTPFYYNGPSPLKEQLDEAYNESISSSPGEMYFRGYETTLRFAFLLLDAKEDLASSLARKGNTIFTPFDIQPVVRYSSSMNLDYFENRHLFFIKNIGGSKIILSDY